MRKGNYSLDIEESTILLNEDVITTGRLRTCYLGHEITLDYNMKARGKYVECRTCHQNRLAYYRKEVKRKRIVNMINSHWLDKSGHLHVLTTPQPKDKQPAWKLLDTYVTTLGYNSESKGIVEVTKEYSLHIIYYQPEQLELLARKGTKIND